MNSRDKIVRAIAVQISNVFCATGEGGGVDPSCGKGKSGGEEKFLGKEDLASGVPTKLSKLKAGDKIAVKSQDGKYYSHTVVSVKGRGNGTTDVHTEEGGKLNWSSWVEPKKIN